MKLPHRPGRNDSSEDSGLQTIPCIASLKSHVLPIGSLVLIAIAGEAKLGYSIA
jgi:hypothetical protein